MNSMKRFIACLMLLTMCFTTFSVEAAIEKITTDTSIPNWTVTSSYVESETYIDNEIKASGNGSLKLVNYSVATNSNMQLRADTTVSVQKGSTYEIVFDAKLVNGNNVWFKFDWAQTHNLAPIAKSYDWTEYKFSYTPSASGIMYLRFGVSDKTEGLWLDNIKLYDKADKSKTNLVQNGDFEAVVLSEVSNLENFYISKGEITVDGDVSEWGDIPMNEIPRVQSCNGEPTPDEPNRGYIRYMFDDKYLYLDIKAEDNIHYPIRTANYWTSDGVQLAVAMPTDGTAKQIGATYFDAEDETTVYGFSDVLAAGNRDGNITRYEMAVPWTIITAKGVPDKFLFNMLINNNDGAGRDYCLEIAPGISQFKSLAQAQRTCTLRTVGDISYSMSELASNYETNVEQNAEIYFANNANETKTIQIICDRLNLNKTISVPANDTYTFGFTSAIDSISEEVVTFKFKTDGVEDIYTKVLTHKPNKNDYLMLREKAIEYKAELSGLMLECDKKGIATDYEAVNYAVISRFIDYMENEANHGEYGQIDEYRKTLTRLYEEAKTNLNAYLNGQKTPINVPKYITGDIEKDGVSLKATTFDGNKQGERPVFFVGFCPNTGALDEEHPFFSALGANYTTYGYDISKVLRPVEEAGLDGWNTTVSNNGTAVYTVSNEEKAEGNYSLKITNNRGVVMNSIKYLQREIKVKPNTTYEYGLKAKGINANELWFSVDGWSTSDTSNKKYLEGTFDWTDYSYEFTTRNEQKMLNFFILCGDITTAAYLDEIYVREKGTEENLVSNGGFEVISNEMSELNVEAAKEGWYLDYSEISAWEERLENAEKNNVLVGAGVNLHYLPDFIKNSDPAITSTGLGFLPYAAEHPTAKKAIELSVRAFLSKTKDYKSLFDICVCNEPVMRTDLGTYYIPEWQEYIKGLYGTIEKLNEVYDSDYNSFEEVAMSAAVKDDALSQDWVTFNDMVFTRFHRWIVGVVKDVAPDIMATTKVMDYFNYRYDVQITKGSNYELVADVLDLNSNDAFSYYGDADYPLTLKMGWYDFQSSVKDSPVWNMEDHIIADEKEIVYEDERVSYVAADIWNGAVHGRAGTSIWIYDTSDLAMPWNTLGRTYYGTNFALRPAELAGVGKTALDLNRLSDEIVAIQKEERKTAVVYSRTSLIHNDNYMKVTGAAYENLLYNGQKVGFVTDTDYTDLEKYKLIVVPEATHISKEMLESLLNYCRNGGRLVIIGDGSLKKDGYRKDHDEKTVEEIYNLATVVSAESSKAAIRNAVDSLKLNDVVLVDTETGETVDMVEWSCAEYNDKYIVNILNYEWEKEKIVKIVYKGSEINSFIERRNETNYEKTITVTPFEPILIEFSK